MPGECNELAGFAAPVLAVCGWSGAGKTTLLESAIPALTARGLRVAALKHDAHRAEVDRAGKDSDRLFRAGADVILDSPGELFARRHAGSSPEEEAGRTRALLEALAADHDVVLVEGHKETPLPKLWLSSAGEPGVPAGIGGLLAALPRDGSRLERFLAFFDPWFRDAWNARPLLGGILIGGLSSRMGSPKHLLEVEGMTLFDRARAALEPVVSRVVALGAGELPERSGPLARLADPPGLEGPLAGVVAALRWAPASGWIIVACDHPRTSPESVAWLRGERAPGRWAVLPRDVSGHAQPFPGLFEPQARAMLERAASRGAGPSSLAGRERAASPRIPDALLPAWRSANRPEDLLAGPGPMS